MLVRLAVCSAVVAAAFSVASVGLSGASHQATAVGPPQIAVPSTATMEDELLQALKAERVASHLPPVRLSPELVALAREHSAEMARRNVLSHESASGKSYAQRLTDAGVGFVASGENVGRGNTFLTKLIHQAFMDSPAHRENILNPEFDSVGIGVAIRNGDTYLVTMDFIKRLTRKSGAEIRTMTLGALNDARAKVRRAPIVLVDSINRIADQLAEAKAVGGEVPEVPLIGRRSPAFFVTGVDLDGMVASVRGLEVEGFGRGGVGSTFSRSRDYPAGAYVVCIILVWNGS